MIWYGLAASRDHRAGNTPISAGRLYKWLICSKFNRIRDLSAPLSDQCCFNIILCARQKYPSFIIAIQSFCRCLLADRYEDPEIAAAVFPLRADVAPDAGARLPA